MIGIRLSKNDKQKWLYLMSQYIQIKRVTYPYQTHATYINFTVLGLQYSNQSRLDVYAGIYPMNFINPRRTS